MNFLEIIDDYPSYNLIAIEVSSVIYLFSGPNKSFSLHYILWGKDSNEF